MNSRFVLSQIIYGLEAVKRFSNSLNNAFRIEFLQLNDHLRKTLKSTGLKDQDYI